MNKSLMKHLAAFFFSGMIIVFNAPYNLGYASLERPTWIAIIILSSACFILIEIIFFWKTIDRIFSISFKKALFILNFILVISVVIFFICQIKHYQYMQFAGWELATFQQMFWNTVNNGGFLYTSLEGACRLFTHLTPLVLIALPFYALCQHVYTLFFIQSIFFCYAALPLFLIASKKLNNISGIAISLSFLFYPFIIGPTFISFRETVFIAFFMFFAFYFFEEKRFYLYLLSLLLVMMARETVPLTCLMFAIYAIIKKRPARWIMVTIILSLSYFLFFLSMQKFIGYTAFESLSFRFKEAYGYSGNGPIIPAIINKLSNPKMLMAAIFNIVKIIYIYKLLSPCALIFPLLSIEILFIIPQLLIILVSDYKLFLSPAWHHSVDISIFLWISSVFSISKIANNKKINQLLSTSKKRLSLIISIFISLMALSSYHTWYIKDIKMGSSYYETVKEAVSSIPPDASVCASCQLLPFLSERRYIAPLYTTKQTDYIVIDRKIEKQDVDDSKAIEALKYNLAKRYKIIFCRESITVYKKSETLK